MKNKKQKYHYFYKITNNINNHFYYGVHSTNNLNDGYMGSGKRLHYAYKKYGIENFSKEILKFFNTSKEAYEYEGEIVTEELIKSNECYNMVTGGNGGWKYLNENFRHVKDKDGNYFFVEKEDPRIKSGELIGHQRGIIREYMHDHFVAKDRNNNFYYVSKNDPRILSGELVMYAKGTVLVKDNFGNVFKVNKNDPRYLSGEVKLFWCGRKRKKESIEKAKNTYKQINHSQGEKNSQYGTCWIYKFNENNVPINKKIKKEELEKYINQGWNKGRKFDKHFSEKVKNGLKHKLEGIPSV